MLSGLIINLCLGSVYSWSVFRKPLEELFELNAMQSGFPSMFFLVFYSVLMPFAGRYLDRFGPRVVLIVGAILVSTGWILASYSRSLLYLILGYGVIAGTGVGIAYGAPIAVSSKWFEGKRGFAVGLTVLGFGLSPLVTAPLAKKLIEVYGPLLTFRILGIVFLIVIILFSIPSRFPNKEERTTKEVIKAPETASCLPSEMVKTKNFWALWVCFVIGTLSGLMVIGISSPVGQEVVRLSSETAAILVSIFAIFNGIGRPFFGWLADKITPRYAATFNFSLTLCATLGMLFAKKGMIFLFLITFSLLWLSFGGWLSIAPTATAKFFGTTHYSKNYGLLFTGYGVGAILGNLISGKIRDVFGSYIFNFYITAILSIVGILVAVFYLKPVVRLPKN